MGKFQATLKYLAIFLALVTCNDCHLTYGRKIKPLNQRSLLNTHTIKLEVNPHPTLPPLKTSVHVPTPSSEKKFDSSMNYDTAGFGDSGAAYTNAFQPTTPGSSPGVGHKKFAGEDKDVKAMVAVQSPDVKVFVNGFSPGVGHAYPNKNGQLN